MMRKITNEAVHVLRSLGEGGRIASYGVDGVLPHEVADQLRTVIEKPFPLSGVNKRIGSVGILLPAAHFVQRVVVAQMIAHEDLHRLVFESFHAVEELLAALQGKAELAQEWGPHRIDADSAVHPGVPDDAVFFEPESVFFFEFAHIDLLRFKH